jgi:hypothetical protein
MVAGDYFGVATDDNVNLAKSSGGVFDLFEAAGVSYKGYMEGYPGESAAGSLTFRLALQWQSSESESS